MELENPSSKLEGIQQHNPQNMSTITTADTTTLDNLRYLPYEKMGEGTALLLIATIGALLNLFIFGMILVFRDLRSYTNGFTAHACLLNTFKCSLAIPYALSLLDVMEPPKACNVLGLAYVIILTVSMFNLLAIILSDAYIFYEKNVAVTDGRQGAITCLLFGITTIYVGSIILHLGPTLIGGEFEHNEGVGNCTFAYGKVQNFIVHVIWIIIMTLTLIVILRYICKFYSQLKANEKFRITNLARNAVAYTKGQTPSEDIYDMVHRLKKRVRVFVCLALIYFFCWYPLFILTLIDYQYLRPRFLYRILTVLAWSHSTLIPLTYLLIDQQFSVIKQFKKTLTINQSNSASPSQQRLMTSTSAISSANNSTHTGLHQNLRSSQTFNNNNTASSSLYLMSRFASSNHSQNTTTECSEQTNQRPGRKEIAIEKLSDFEEEIDMPPLTQAEYNRLLPDQKYEDDAV